MKYLLLSSPGSGRGGYGLGPQDGMWSFGIDLKGPIGGGIRIDGLVIEDLTELFFWDFLNQVDVRDYGALGDGSADDRAAVFAADAAATGREILVPAGTYFIDRSLILHAPMSFKGTLKMSESLELYLTKPFDLAIYIQAFGDKETGFPKLFNRAWPFRSRIVRHRWAVCEHHQAA